MEVFNGCETHHIIELIIHVEYNLKPVFQALVGCVPWKEAVARRGTYNHSDNEVYDDGMTISHCGNTDQNYHGYRCTVVLASPTPDRITVELNI